MVTSEVQWPHGDVRSTMASTRWPRLVATEGDVTGLVFPGVRLKEAGHHVRVGAHYRGEPLLTCHQIIAYYTVGNFHSYNYSTLWGGPSLGHGPRVALGPGLSCQTHGGLSWLTLEP